MATNTTTPKPPKNEELQASTHLVRTVESSLKIEVPDDTDLKFIGSLMRAATAQIGTLPASFIIRLYIAACDVKFPAAEVADFRHALQRQLGTNLGLAAYKEKK